MSTASGRIPQTGFGNSPHLRSLGTCTMEEPCSGFLAFREDRKALPFSSDLLHNQRATYPSQISWSRSLWNLMTTTELGHCLNSFWWTERTFLVLPGTGTCWREAATGIPAAVAYTRMKGNIKANLSLIQHLPRSTVVQTPTIFFPLVKHPSANKLCTLHMQIINPATLTTSKEHAVSN